MYQLTGVNRVEEPSVLKEASPDELLEKERGKKFVITFLKASIDEKFRLTSEKYKRLHQNAEVLRRLFNKESYEKIDFQEVTLFVKGTARNLNIRTNLYWAAEGYEGVQTVYFMLAKEKDQWVLDWLVY